MTSVPKPFKFIKSHFKPLEEHYKQVRGGGEEEVVQRLADIMSILAMSYSDTPQESLRYLLESTREEVTEWGYGYMSHLSGEIAQEYQRRLAHREDSSELVALVTRLAPKLIETNAESEAVDLLLEVDQLSLISEYVNQGNYQKINQYLLCCSQYNSDPEEMQKILELNFSCLLNLGHYS